MKRCIALLWLLAMLLTACGGAPEIETIAPDTTTTQSENVTQPISQISTETTTTESTTEATTEPTTEATTEPTAETTTEPTTEATTEPTTETTTEPITEEEPTTQAEDAGLDYVVNINSGKFHESSCSSAASIASYNRWDYHGTREELIDKGYVPCKRCNP